jgi:hypothetical protein
MPRGGKREGAGAKPRSDSPAPQRTIRFTDAEWELIKQKSDAEGKTISDYIRDRVLG